MVTNTPVKHVCDKDLKAELKKAARAAQNKCYCVADDFYRNRFEPVVQYYLSMGCPSPALDKGIEFLKRCHSLDPEAYKDIPKGTPFYWLGTAAFQTHDYQSALYFYDAAASEDIKAEKKPDDKDSPAFSFILLDGNNPRQAAKDLVKAAEQQVCAAIKDYNGRGGAKQLTIADLRKGFLRKALGHDEWRSLATAFISFFLEWEYRSTMLELRVGEGTLEPFYIHLFKGCLLFESLLKVCPDRKPTCDPKPCVETCALGQILGKKWYNDKPGFFSKKDADGLEGGVTFPDVLGKLKCAGNTTTAAIQFTHQIRNTTGHNLGWTGNMCRAEYAQLFRMVSASCLHTIACLYVKRNYART